MQMTGRGGKKQKTCTQADKNTLTVCCLLLLWRTCHICHANMLIAASLSPCVFVSVSICVFAHRYPDPRRSKGASKATRFNTRASRGFLCVIPVMYKFSPGDDVMLNLSNVTFPLGVIKPWTDRCKSHDIYAFVIAFLFICKVQYTLLRQPNSTAPVPGALHCRHFQSYLHNNVKKTPTSVSFDPPVYLLAAFARLRRANGTTGCLVGFKRTITKQSPFTEWWLDWVCSYSGC